VKTFKEFYESKQKHSKEEAGYVGHTVKGQRCDQCTMWRAPNKCSAVAGDIKPEAWCEWWKQSHRKDLTEAVLKRIEEGMPSLDTIQAALDVAGIEPTYGTAADATNTVISGLRAALSKEPDERKKHIINAGISAISMIPFADVIKLLKLRKAKPVAKLAVQGSRALKTYGKSQQATGQRFNPVTEKSIHDPVRPGILKRQTK